MPAGPEQMAERRGVILGAAEKLIRETGSADFTMEALARAAGVSRATPFNLFESKRALLYALLNRSLDDVHKAGLAASTENDPYKRLMKSAEAVSRFFAADSDFYRPLYRVLLGVQDPLNRPAFMQRSLDYWRRAVSGFDDAPDVPAGLSSASLAQKLLTMYVGLMNLWVHDEISDQELVTEAVQGALMLASIRVTGVPSEPLLRLFRDWS